MAKDSYDKRYGLVLSYDGSEVKGKKKCCINELYSAYCLLIGVPPDFNYLIYTHNTSFGKFTDKWLN